MLQKISSTKFSAEQIEDIQRKIDDVNNAFPELAFISPEQRRKNQNIRMGGIGFIRRTQKASRVKAELVNGFINPDVFEDSLISYDQEKAFYDRISALRQKLEDDLILKGQFIMAQANEVYAAVKRAAKRDPEYQALYDELSIFYKKTKSKKVNATINNPTDNA